MPSRCTLAPENDFTTKTIRGQRRIRRDARADRIRLVDIIIDQPGFRSKKFTIATTMLQREVFTRNWLMSVYRSRWLVGLDIRTIKCSLGMDIVRAKTPDMVQTEIWSCLLAYI